MMRFTPAPLPNSIMGKGALLLAGRSIFEPEGLPSCSHPSVLFTRFDLLWQRRQ